MDRNRVKKNLSSVYRNNKKRVRSKRLKGDEPPEEKAHIYNTKCVYKETYAFIIFRVNTKGRCCLETAKEGG